MTLALFLCPVCGVAVFQNPSVGEYPRPRCAKDTSELSFVWNVRLPPASRSDWDFWMQHPLPKDEGEGK